MNHNRRNFLRGIAGTTLALPWMESLNADTVGSGKPRQRIAFYYVPIGVVRRGFFPGEAEAGIPKFSSNQVEVAVETGVKRGLQPLALTPTMEPLADVKEDVMLITGTDRVFQQGTDVHAQCASCYLSSAAPFTIKQSAWPLDRTLDHILGDAIGQSTPFRTLEFSCNSHKDNKESIYFDNISWYGTGHVAPSIRDPRKMYERLFGTREADTISNITDLVREDARDMQRGLGVSDRQKFAEFFDSLRTIELQMERLETMRSEIASVGFEEPAASHLPRGEYIRLMGDLMVVALQTGLTNVATFMIGPERWDTPFTYESLFDKPRSHHQMSHNQNKFIDDLLRVDRFHMEQFAYIVERMKAIEESDGSTLLDNTILTYGSGLGDGATHQYSDLPIIVAGRGGGKLRTGQHLHLAEGTPLANLWLTQSNAMGVDLPRFADSTGMTEDLFA
ncbi:MAG: DUF1552 domain-containing protein [Planctomycetota bacterium]